jgi:hypothetical protein
MSHLRAVFFFTSLAFLLLSSPILAAQQSKQAPPAPVPAQILAAKKIFISNAGGDTDAPYTGGPDRAYNQFYAAMKKWGRYQVVDSPANADLLLEIRFMNPPAGVDVTRGSSTGSTYDPQFRLLFRDPKTQALLWGITEHIQSAILQTNREKNFDAALSRLVSAVQRLAEVPPLPSQPAKQNPEAQ